MASNRDRFGRRCVELARILEGKKPEDTQRVINELLRMGGVPA